VQFHDFTISSDGRSRSTRVHDSERLEPLAVAVFRRMLERGGDVFREDVPVPVPGVQLHWTSEHPSAALATFWHGGVPVTTSALLRGIDPEADSVTVGLLQAMIEDLCGQCGITAKAALLVINERPVIASYIIPNPRVDREVLGLVADMETCLAAAFFTREESTP
jgi:hypothetical protein